MVREVIGQAGGQISSHDNVLTLLFPPGSLSEDVTIEITPSDEPPPTIGAAYRVKPDIDLSVAAEVTYRRLLPSDPSGVAVAAIHRSDYLDGHGYWKPLPRTTLDVTANLVAGLDYEISLYYSMLEDGYEGESTGSTTGDVSSTSTSTTTGPAESSSSGEPQESSSGEVLLSYAVDIQPIWDQWCLACHAALYEPILVGEAGYETLVNESSPSANMRFVTPEDPWESYLVHKLNDTHRYPEPYGCGCGGETLSMPQGLPLLAVETRELVEAWVEQGALP